MPKPLLLLLSILSFVSLNAQLPIARDTISVLENGYVLKMPWANGLNYVNASNIDLNGDGKKDLVLFERFNLIGIGKFRCFVNESSGSQIKYKAEPDWSYYFPKVKSWAILRDYNGDGKEDIFCSTDLGIKVFKNTGSSNGINFSIAKNVLNSNYSTQGSPQISNLYAASNGVPGLADIDNDGDIDILTFQPQGIFIEWHKNLSEQFFTKDSLNFAIGDFCWGKISESSCNVNFNTCPSSKEINKPQHAGSCLTCIDDDNDNDQDLILGDIACNTVQYARNSGNTTSALFNDTTSMYPNYPAKNSTTQLRLDYFPCAYTVDVNNDNITDLLASPNVNNRENSNSLWFYKNNGSISNSNFQFVKKNFLQDEMIEVGQNSYPLLFDYNADGKKDLLIGTQGYYQNNSMKSQLTLYKNIGSNSAPVFSLITRDYANVSAQSLNYAMPAVGDIDADGDVDLLIGNSSGQVHWLENTGGVGNVCNFSIFHTNPFSFTTTAAIAAPQLFDLNQDGKLDLVIGMKNGRVSYYQNTGTSTQPIFSLITHSLGAISVTANPLEYGPDGNAAPFFFMDGTDIKVLVGSTTGQIFLYQITNGILNPFSLINSNVNSYSEGLQSTVWFEDINADGKKDLFIGNSAGGLSYFSSASPYVGIKKYKLEQEINNEITAFPNPVNNNLTVNFGQLEIIKSNIEILNQLNQTVYSQIFHENKIQLPFKDFSEGIYILKIEIYSEKNKYTVFRKIFKLN